MKRKEGNYTGKSTSNDTNGEKGYKKTRNIEDLMKRKGIRDTRSTTSLDKTRAAVDNGNRGMGGGRVIGRLEGGSPHHMRGSPRINNL